MEGYVITILGGLLLAFFTFELGYRITGKNKVSDDTCKERREACNALVCQKIDALHIEMVDIKTYVQNLNKE